MPGRDGTGPLRGGAMTGRGFGLCTGINPVRYGPGLGYGCNSTIPLSQKELLSMQKERLENRLDFVNKQLDSL